MDDANRTTDRRPAKLDSLDRDILALLLRNARLSTRAIGRALGVAAGTVGQRIARLEASGVIRGYAVQVDAAQLGRPLRFVAGLQMNQGNEMARAMDELIALPEVDEVLAVTGRWDVLVLGRVADPQQLNELLTRGLWQSPSFRHSETMIVIDDRDRSESHGAPLDTMVARP